MGFFKRLGRGFHFFAKPLQFIEQPFKAPVEHIKEGTSYALGGEENVKKSAIMAGQSAVLFTAPELLGPELAAIPTSLNRAQTLADYGKKGIDIIQEVNNDNDPQQQPQLAKSSMKRNRQGKGIQL